MKTLLSLFDYSGTWSESFANNGWEVIQWDIKLDEFMNIENFKDCETVFDIIDTGYYDIQGIIAAPPCTDFAVSGAQYWKQKDKDGRTGKSLEFVYQVKRLVDLFRPTDPDYFEENPDSSFFWAVENPVGRMGKLADLGTPYYFNPYEFAGWLNPSKETVAALDEIRLKNGFNVSSMENRLVLSSNAYTKKTGLWGEFNRNLVKKPIPPVRTAHSGSPIQRLGGKSEKTKEERSNAPLGFALAFYEANKDFRSEGV